MSRSLEHALLSLLPTYNEALPAELKELAGSLLAQSKQRASTLKAEEEVARAYACAHLACDRLKISLNLPPIDARPPIPPRVYKRLYTYLEQTLAASSTPSRANLGRTRTPTSARFRDASASPSIRGLSSRRTPSRAESLSQFCNRAASKPNTPSKLSRTDARWDAQGQHLLPLWVRPTLKRLCQKLENPDFVPVMMAGVESIATPNGKRTDDKWILDHLPGILGALYLYIWKSMYAPDVVDRENWARTTRTIVQALEHARETVSLPGVDGSDAWEGWRDTSGAELNVAVKVISQNGWLQQDWVQGIDDLIQSRARTTLEEPTNGVAGTTKDDHNMRSADIMLQNQFDYLSEQSLQDFTTWKSRILERIRSLERDSIDEMDVDP